MDLSTITAWQYALFLVLIVWSFVWKGIGLWKSARNNDMAWFLAILIINSLGILEIFYIFIFSKRNSNTVKPVK